MSLVINTNYSATVAANNLAYSNSQLTNSLNELSSGSKLYSSAADAGGTEAAADDNAAALNDAAKLELNATNLSGLVTTDGSLQVAGSILARMSQLNALSGSGSGASGDYASEFTALQTELSSNSSLSGIAGVSAIDTGSPTAANIKTAIDAVSADRASNGAQQSVDNFNATLISNDETNQQSAFSTVSDVDVAQASTQLAKWNVLVQAGTAMLAQANQQTQLALKLLQ